MVVVGEKAVHDVVVGEKAVHDVVVVVVGEKAVQSESEKVVVGNKVVVGSN